MIKQHLIGRQCEARTNEMIASEKSKFSLFLPLANKSRQSHFHFLKREDEWL